MPEKSSNAVDVIRRPVRSAVGAGLLGIVTLFALGGVVSAHSVSGVIVWGLLLVLAASAAVRMARSGIVVDQNGLMVRDTVRTRRIEWGQVQYISPATDDPAFRAVGVVTQDGRVRCYALSALRFERDPSGARL
jgi:hypothetical protein